MCVRGGVWAVVCVQWGMGGAARTYDLEGGDELYDGQRVEQAHGVERVEVAVGARV